MSQQSLLAHMKPTKKIFFEAKSVTSCTQTLESAAETVQISGELAQLPMKLIKVSEDESSFKFTMKTQNLVDKLKAKQVSQSSFSNNQEKCLHNSYLRKTQELLLILEKTDLTITNLKIQNKKPFLLEIKAMVEDKLNPNDFIQNLSEIMFISPLYSVSSELNADKNVIQQVLEPIVQPNDVKIYYLTKEIREKRKAFFEECLKNYYLQKKTLSIRPKSDVFAIPESKVFWENSSTIKSEQENSKQTEIAEKKSVFGLQKLNKFGFFKNKESNLDRPKTSSSSAGVAVLRENILNEIREKEKWLLNKSNDQKIVFFDESVDFFSDLVRIIKFYYQMRKVKNMFLVKVIDYIQKNYKKVKAKEEIMQAIKQISENVPNWMSIITNESGLILRVDTSLEIDEILQTVKNQPI